MKKKILSSLLALALVITTLQMPQYAGKAKAAGLPSYYSSVEEGYTTPVRDQGKWGTCWTFATMAAIETSLVKQGLADRNVDLSELAYAYFMFNNQVDPLGLTAGDGVEAVHSSWLDEGGYMNWACWLLAMNQGLMYEADAPYAGANEKTKVNADYAYGRTPYAVKNVYWANIQNRDDIKNLIMNYGGVVVSYYMNESFFNEKKDAYNWDRSEDATGHASLIVGWDDHYSASNFKVQPSTDGAWLVKNSWGADANDGGYFWMSYECSTQELGESWYQPCYAIEMMERSYDNIYQYDGCCGESYSGFADRSANVFRTFGKERLEAISFAFNNDEVTYNYTIYKDLKDMSDPTSGTVVASGNGTSHYAGYHVVEITPVELPENCSYSVVVEGKRGDIAEGVLCESTSVFPCMDVSASMMDGTSWEYVTWEGKWNKANNNYRIKAFTTNLEGLATESEAMHLDGYKKDNFTFSYNHLNRTFWIMDYSGSATELVIPNEVDGIRVAGILSEAFSKNKTLKNVTIDGLDVLSSKAFTGCNLERVVVKNVTDIGMMAFAECQLESVYLENVSGAIEFNAFADNDNITEFTLVGHIGTINAGAFGPCPKLKRIEFPSVDVLYNPFGWGSGVEEVVINGDVGELRYRIFDQISYGTERNEYTGRFSDIHLNLKKFVINGKIDSVEESLLGNPGTSFDNSAIAELVCGLDVQVAGSVDGMVYSEDGHTLLMALPNSTVDTYVVTPDIVVSPFAFTYTTGVKHIICDEEAFQLLYLTDMVDLETIDAGICEVMLAGYTPNLTDIFIATENSAFTHTESSMSVDENYILKFGFTEHEVTVHAPANSKAEWEARMNGYSFEDTTNGVLYERKPRISGDYILTEDGSCLLAMKRKNGKEIVPEVEVICNGVYALYNDNSGDNPYTLTEIVIPESVKVIGRSAFKYTQPKRIQLPSGLEIIGNDAFSNCGYFDEWDLGNALFYVGDFAFSETYIDKLIFPESFHELSGLTIAGTNASHIVFKGDIRLGTSGGLLGHLWREPESITFEGEVTMERFAPVATYANFTTFIPAYKDFLCYSLLHFGASIGVDPDTLPEAPHPIDPERAELFFTAYDTYLAYGYPGYLFPYTYDELDLAVRDQDGNFIFTDDIVYGGAWIPDSEPPVEEGIFDENIESEEPTGEAAAPVEEIEEELAVHLDVGALLLLIVVVAAVAGGIVGVVVLIKKKKRK